MFAKRTYIAASATATVHAAVQALKREGKILYDLSVGEPVVPNSPFIREAAHAAIERNENFYPPVAGFEELREAASAWINEQYDCHFKKENTLVTAGGKFGIHLTLQALVEPGDEVVMVAPHWVSYPSIVELYGGTVKLIHAREENVWKISPTELEAACTDRTKIFILNNGCNPTGALYSHTELEALLKALPQKTWLLSDEVYSGLVYDGASYSSCGALEGHADRMVVVQSCSKNFGMTGWRIGFVFGPTPFIDVLVKLQGQSLTSASSVGQWAALAALQHASSIQKDLCALLEERRNAFISGLSDRIQKVKSPASALYLFLPISYFGDHSKDDIAFCQKLLEQVQVALIPGTAFGCPGYVRLAYGGTLDHLEACLNRLALYKA